jgi:hypothetical protein
MALTEGRYPGCINYFLRNSRLTQNRIMVKLGDSRVCPNCVLFRAIPLQAISWVQSPPGDHRLIPHWRKQRKKALPNAQKCILCLAHLWSVHGRKCSFFLSSSTLFSCWFHCGKDPSHYLSTDISDPKRVNSLHHLRGLSLVAVAAKACYPRIQTLPTYSVSWVSPGALSYSLLINRSSRFRTCSGGWDLQSSQETLLYDRSSIVCLRGTVLVSNIYLQKSTQQLPYIWLPHSLTLRVGQHDCLT